MSIYKAAKQPSST